MKSREIPEIEEVTKEELQQLSQELFSVKAMLETAALALYHVQEEPEPISKAVTISFAVQHAAEELGKLEDTIRCMSDNI